MDVCDFRDEHLVVADYFSLSRVFDFFFFGLVDPVGHAKRLRGVNHGPRMLDGHLVLLQFRGSFNACKLLVYNWDFSVHLSKYKTISEKTPFEFKLFFPV